MKRVDYLLSRDLRTHALVLAMRRVMERQAARGEKRPARDRELQMKLAIEG